MNLKELVKKEMKLLIDNEHYYGSKEQIKAERIILIFAFKDLGIEMKYKECLEEYYYRILKTL